MCEWIVHFSILMTWLNQMTKKKNTHGGDGTKISWNSEICIKFDFFLKTELLCLMKTSSILFRIKQKFNCARLSPSSTFLEFFWIDKTFWLNWSENTLAYDLHTYVVENQNVSTNNNDFRRKRDIFIWNNLSYAIWLVEEI